MERLARFGVSIPEKLLGKFDDYLDQKKYPNRSEAIRDLIRAALVDEAGCEADAEMIAAISIVFDHHKREIEDKLVDIQHRYFRNIVSATHVHIDEHNCFEVIIVRGRAATVREVADLLIGAKGVRIGKVSMLTTDHP